MSLSLFAKKKKKDIGPGLRKYWKNHYKGRPKGSFEKAVDTLKDKVDNPEGLAAWLEHESTGKWPAEGRSKKKKKKSSKYLNLVAGYKQPSLFENKKED